MGAGPGHTWMGKKITSRGHPITPLGARLKEERLRRGWPLREFADACGLSHTQITGIENRGALPRWDTAIAICQVLECSMDWLAGLEE